MAEHQDSSNTHPMNQPQDQNNENSVKKVDDLSNTHSNNPNQDQSNSHSNNQIQDPSNSHSNNSNQDKSNSYSNNQIQDPSNSHANNQNNDNSENQNFNKLNDQTNSHSKNLIDETNNKLNSQNIIINFENQKNEVKKNLFKNNCENTESLQNQINSQKEEISKLTEIINNLTIKLNLNINSLNKLENDFKNNLIYKTIDYPNGYKYIGYTQNNKRESKGTMIYSNTEKYVG